MKPFFSIVIATYNPGNKIKRSLSSIFSQDYINFEVLIKDGGSTDKTNSIIESYKNKIAYFNSSNDNGIYDAWNHALSFCNGEWICFLGADDYFVCDDTLSRYAYFLKNIDTTQYTFSYGIDQVVNKNDEILYTIGQPWDTLKGSIKNFMCLPHPGSMHHYTIFKLVGKFNQKYRISGDYEMVLRVLKRQKPIFWPNIVCATTVGGISSSPANYLKCLIENRRAQISNGWHSSWIYSAKQWSIVIILLSLRFMFNDQRYRYILDYIRNKRGLPPFWTKAI